jgi:hypothetical protein
MKFVLFFLISLNVNASFDFNYGTNIRSYPGLGGGLKTNSGYTFLLRGTDKSPLNSLLRVGLQADTSLVVQKLEPSITLYPLGFFGLSTGSTVMKSDYEDFDYLNCDQVRCTGDLNKRFILGKLALAYGPLISTAEYRASENSYSTNSNKTLSVLEYEYALKVQAEEEIEIDKKYFLGFKISEKNLFGFLSSRAEFLESDKFFQMNIAIYSHSISNMNFVIGAGNFNNSDLSSSPLVIFQFKHQILPSMTLF